MQVSVVNTGIEPAFIAGTQFSWTANRKFAEMFVAQEKIVGQPEPFFFWMGKSPNNRIPGNGVLVKNDNRFAQWNAGPYPNYDLTRFAGSQAMTNLQVTFNNLTSKLENTFTKDDFAESQLVFSVAGKNCRVPFSLSKVVALNDVQPIRSSVVMPQTGGLNIGSLAFDENADNNIYLRDPSGTLQGLTTFGNVLSRASWAYDGSQITFVRRDPFIDQGGNTVYYGNVYKSAGDGSGTPTRLTNNDPMVGASYYGADWSPTASLIVYSTGLSLHTIHTDGSSDTILTSTSNIQYGYFYNRSCQKSISPCSRAGSCR